jgi:hypothetical protein
MRSSETRHKQINDCRNSALRDFPNEFVLAKQVDKIYYEIMDKIGYVRPQTAPQKANFALAIRNYRLFHCAIDLTETGYYEVVMTLLRATFENFLQMNYFVKFEDEARKWLDEGKKISQKEIRDKLGVTGEMYGFLSVNFAHSLKSKSLNPLMFLQPDGHVALNQYPSYSENQCRMSIILWLMFAEQTIEGLQKVFPKSLITDKAWLQKITDIQTIVMTYIQELMFEARQNNQEKTKTSS